MQLRQLWSREAAEEWLWSQKNSLSFPEDADVGLDGLKLFKNHKREPTLDNLYRGYTEGGTIIIQNMKQHPTVFSLIVEFERIFGVPVSVNSYLSPRSTQRALGTPGFHYHWDQSDTVILQVEGTKLWTVCDRKWPLPVPSVMQTVDGLDCANMTLSAGDVLYLPMGAVHKAWATSAADSVHLTVAIDCSLQSWSRIIIHLLQATVSNVCTPTAIDPADGWEEELVRVDPIFSQMGLMSIPQMKLSLNDDDLPPSLLEHTIMPLIAQQVAAAIQKAPNQMFSFVPPGCSKTAADLLLGLTSDKHAFKTAVGAVMDALRCSALNGAPCSLV